MFENNILYEKSKYTNLLPRSYPQKDTPLLLYGPPKSGKTSLALQYAKIAKNPVFIDCADMRFSTQEAKTDLLKLFLEKGFDLLVVDNYGKGLTLPNFSNIILITNAPFSNDFHAKNTNDLNKSLASPQEKMKQEMILPLSFREFVSFSKTQRLEGIFSTFLKSGNLPEMPFLLESKHSARNQEIIRLAYPRHTEIFLELVGFQGRVFSTLGLLAKLKPYLKTSKDTVYAFVENLKSQGSIFLLPHSDFSSGAKSKLYLYNFALPYSLIKTPNFQHIFENMIFCELLIKYGAFGYAFDSKNKHSKNVINYNDECDFLINDIAYLAMPFPNETLLKARLDKLTNAYKKIIVISIEHSQKHKDYEIQSFIDFALDDEGL